jgi:hypothetical protein
MGADASIRIKLGEVEVEYKGDETFLKKELLETVKELLELQEKHPTTNGAGSGDTGGHGKDTGGHGKFDHSTDTIATVLGSKSGPDLIMAAAAHLHFVQGKQKFTRQEIIAEMRAAPGHYKESYNKNLTNYLERLTSSQRLRLLSEDTYALSADERKKLEAKLAEAS